MYKIGGGWAIKDKRRRINNMGRDVQEDSMHRMKSEKNGRENHKEGKNVLKGITVDVYQED